MNVVTFSYLIMLVAGMPPAPQEPSGRTITGVVVDSSRRALPYVNVQVGSMRTATTESGRFLIRFEGRSQAKVSFRRMGFVPIDTLLTPGDSSLTVVMLPLAVRLSTVEVLGANMSHKLELRGFYERMRDVERGINRGYFITPEDLDSRKPNFITQMLEGYPSIRVNSQYGQHNARLLGVGNCAMTVYLDGARVVGGFNPRSEDPINVLVKPNEIAGVEIYPRNVGAPPQYQSLNGSCGIVVIWTK